MSKVNNINGMIVKVIDNSEKQEAFSQEDKDMDEIVSKKAAIKMKGIDPKTEIRCFDGYAHAQISCFEPQNRIKEVSQFLS